MKNWHDRVHDNKVDSKKQQQTLSNVDSCTILCIFIIINIAIWVASHALPRCKWKTIKAPDFFSPELVPSLFPTQDSRDVRGKIFYVQFFVWMEYFKWQRWFITWCPEQIVPFGILALKGLCTGHDVRGPHRDEGPGNGTELKLFCCWLLQGLHNGGGGNWPCSDVIEGPCASIGRWGICIWWWHIEPAQLGIGHCPPLLIPPLLQYGSTVKLSWLLEHFSWNVGGGDDCRE